MNDDENSDCEEKHIASFHNAIGCSDEFFSIKKM